MEEEEFEKLLGRINEQYNNNSEFEIPFRTRTLDCFGKMKLKEILEEVFQMGITHQEMLEMEQDYLL